jgi:hypothetical protein
LIQEGPRHLGADPELLERERSARAQLSAHQQARLELLTRAHTPEEEQRLSDEIQPVPCDSVVITDLFFHHSEVQGVAFEELREGQMVEYNIGQGRKGPCATGVRLVDKK